jgi:hypothetical protein
MMKEHYCKYTMKYHEQAENRRFADAKNRLIESTRDYPETTQIRNRFYDGAPSDIPKNVFVCVYVDIPIRRRRHRQMSTKLLLTLTLKKNNASAFLHPFWVFVICEHFTRNEHISDKMNEEKSEPRFESNTANFLELPA